MSESKLIELGYYDPSAKIRLSAYADTVVLDPDKKGSVICAIRFGGYPEMVRAMADAIYGGATIEATQNGMVRKLQSKLKGYQRQITHDGVYAVATLMAADDAQEETSLQDEDGPEDDRQKGDEEAAPQKPTQPRKCYIFCPEGDRARLFEELDHKTAAPLIPAFQDYVLTSLQNRGDLRQLEVVSQKERIDAWVLTLKPEDKNVVEVLEEGLKTGDIQIPGAVPGFSDGFENVTNVTEYLSEKKQQATVHTLLRLSRLPTKAPRTFENFDFSLLKGRDVERLKALPSLSAIYSHRNLAFIGPVGTGKTHLAQAFGYACCQHGMKTYFIKASELRDRFLAAKRSGKADSCLNALVRPSCLIIDEIGHCEFDKECTRMFFDLIDRRYNKEGNFNMIFTSNKNPALWREDFNEDTTLLCALDRIFDDAMVFKLRGESFRGKKLETISLQTGKVKAVESVTEMKG